MWCCAPHVAATRCHGDGRPCPRAGHAGTGRGGRASAPPGGAAAEVRPVRGRAAGPGAALLPRLGRSPALLHDESCASSAGRWRPRCALPRPAHGGRSVRRAGRWCRSSPGCKGGRGLAFVFGVSAGVSAAEGALWCSRLPGNRRSSAGRVLSLQVQTRAGRPGCGGSD